MSATSLQQFYSRFPTKSLEEIVPIFVICSYNNYIVTFHEYSTSVPPSANNATSLRQLYHTCSLHLDLRSVPTSVSHNCLACGSNNLIFMQMFCSCYQSKQSIAHSKTNNRCRPKDISHAHLTWRAVKMYQLSPFWGLFRPAFLWLLDLTLPSLLGANALNWIGQGNASHYVSFCLQASW
jgi:hypothetical protein